MLLTTQIFAQDHTIQNNTTSVTILPSSIESTHSSNTGSLQDNLSLGKNALQFLGATGRTNVALGKNAMNQSYDAQSNIAIGQNSNYWSVYSDRNVVIGTNALYSHAPNSGQGTDNDDNVAIGYESMKNFFCANSENVGIGGWSLHEPSYQSVGVGIKSGYMGLSSSIAIGRSAGYNGLNSSVAIGHFAGFSHRTTKNIYLGFKAGYFENTNEKLYIENSDSNTPLIGGDFANDIVSINKNVSSLASNPDDKLQIEGNIRLSGAINASTKIITASYTLQPTDYRLIYTGSGLEYITLPLAISNLGREILIINHGYGSFHTYINYITGPTTTANGFPPGESLHLISDGTNWRKIN